MLLLSDMRGEDRFTIKDESQWSTFEEAEIYVAQNLKALETCARFKQKRVQTLDTTMHNKHFIGSPYVASVERNLCRRRGTV